MNASVPTTASEIQVDCPAELVREELKRVHDLSEQIAWRAGTAITFRGSALLEVSYIYHLDGEYCAYSLSTNTSKVESNADDAYVTLIATVAHLWRNKISNSHTRMNFWRIDDNIRRTLAEISSQIEKQTELLNRAKQMYLAIGTAPMSSAADELDVKRVMELHDSQITPSKLEDTNHPEDIALGGYPL